MRTRTLVLTTILAAALLSGCASSRGGADSVDPGMPADAADSEPLLNRLKWSTATEVDNFGFDIYRSLNEDGPFERVNSTPIPGAGTVDEPRSYVYEDVEIDPTRDYYYYVESISLDGIREQFSPVIKAKAKRPVEK